MCDAAEIALTFAKLGRCVAKWPYTILGVCLLFTVGCGVCFGFLFEQELDNEDLYTPTNAQSFSDMHFVVNTFGQPGEEVVCCLNPTADRLISNVSHLYRFFIARHVEQRHQWKELDRPAMSRLSCCSCPCSPK